MAKLLTAISWILALLLSSCQPTPTNSSQSEPQGDVNTQEERPYLLERIGEAAVVQLYADGFDALTLKEKTLIWHLSQSALAGRDIYYNQKHADSLKMRKVLEAIITNANGINEETLEDIERYTKLFWINNGPYNNLTARKFVLHCSPAAFATAAQKAASSGAVFPLTPGEPLEVVLEDLEPMFFDPNIDPVITNKNPPPGKDILTASANNLYVDVSMEDLQGFNEQYGLNSRLVNRNGRLIEEIYRIDGTYGEEISEIVQHLEAAIPYAPETMATALRALVRWYQTGEDTDRVKYDIAWVQDTTSSVDTINGFIEVYLDPRGIKGAWEGLVFYMNPEKTKRIKTIAENAQWFEDRMPWNPEYRKPNVKGIVANAIDVVMEIGDAGPVTPIGINLPNDQSIREQYGSKSVSLSNVNEAYDKSSSPSMRNEFAWTSEEANRAAKWATLARELQTDMHEVIGHASGRVSTQLQGTPHQALKEYSSALEEGRADLVALYFIADNKLAELGALPDTNQEIIVQTMYEAYTTNALVQLRRVREGTQLEQDHMRNRQMVVHWLMANTTAVEQRQRDGKTYYVLVNAKAFHEGVGQLLNEVQRIKSEGDYPAAKDLFETYGIQFNQDLRDEVVARVDALNLPSYTGFVMPKLTPIIDTDGTITDVEISYPLDLKTQMLEYSGHTQ